MINLGFLLREKLAVVLIIPFSWGSQLDGEKPSTPCRITRLRRRRVAGGSIAAGIVVYYALKKSL
jgi:hypothetical protein